MVKGKLYVVEGLDGSGKATQAALLKSRLAASGINAIQLSFPCYREETSVFVRMYLDGSFGESPMDTNPYAASMFYAADRYASFRMSWKQPYQEGAVFVADRYTTSNAVYQMAKLPESQWDDFLLWLNDFEYTKLRLPPPDRVLYLDLPPTESERLLSLRYGGDASKMDIHERDRAYQVRCRAAALYAAQKENWTVIRCAGEDGKIRTQDELSDEISSVIDGRRPQTI